VLDGDFTLKGVTQPVALTLVFNGVNPGMGRGEVVKYVISFSDPGDNAFCKARMRNCLGVRWLQDRALGVEL